MVDLLCFRVQLLVLAKKQFVFMCGHLVFLCVILISINMLANFLHQASVCVGLFMYLMLYYWLEVVSDPQELLLMYI